MDGTRSLVDGTPTGNYARLQALAETLKHPEAVDARCVFAEACRPRKHGDRCRDMPYDRSMERVVEQPEVLSSGEFVYHSGKSWEHPDQHQGPWLHPEEIPAKPYGSYTHSIVDAKPLGEGCRALLKHSAHACAAHKAHASHVAEGDDDIE